MREFLYQAIYLPEAWSRRPGRWWICRSCRSILRAFGTRPGDHCLVAEVEGKVVGAAWCRIMEDYGHIDSSTPSLAISLLPEYRGQGIGTQLLNGLLLLLRENGYRRASLSVQKENPAPPLPASGIPNRGGKRYGIFDALGCTPGDGTGEYGYGSRETAGK